MSQLWLALVIGNTRLHWGAFLGETLVKVWNTTHLTSEVVNQLRARGFEAAAWQAIADSIPKDNAFPTESISALWIASAVPTQLALWLGDTSSTDTSSKVPIEVVVRSHIPLSNFYPTLGLDRAINLLGAGSTIGWPVLVIDAGTALTFTAGAQNTVYGGAILPGIRIQGQALSQGTAALAGAVDLSQSKLAKAVDDLEYLLSERWATDTVGAIASGLIYSTTAVITDYLTDWWQRFPEGKAVITGGDAPLLHALLQKRTPAIAARVQRDSYLMFWGMQAYRKGRILAV